MNNSILIEKLSGDAKSEILKRANAHYWEEEKKLFEVAKILLPYNRDYSEKRIRITRRILNFCNFSKDSRL